MRARPPTDLQRVGDSTYGPLLTSAYAPPSTGQTQDHPAYIPRPALVRRRAGLLITSHAKYVHGCPGSRTDHGFRPQIALAHGGACVLLREEARADQCGPHALRLLRSQGYGPRNPFGQEPYGACSTSPQPVFRQRRHNVHGSSNSQPDQLWFPQFAMLCPFLVCSKRKRCSLA